MTSEIRANKQTNRVGLGTVEYTNTGIVVSGIVTCTELSGLTALNIAGVGTASTLDINGDIDVDGHTNLDNLSVAGVTTMSGNLFINNTSPSITLVDSDNNPDYRIRNQDGTFRITDTTNNAGRLSIASNGNVSVTNDLDVDGHTNLDNVSIAGVVTATTYKGDGSQLSGITQTTISGNANNRIITGSGTANTLNAESTFTYDGDGLLSMTSTSGSAEFTIVGPNNTDSGIYFNDGSNDGAISYDHSTRQLKFRAGGHTRMYFAGGNDSNNNVIYLSNASYDDGILQYYNGGLYLKTGSSNGDRIISFYTAGSHRFRIASDGTVDFYGNQTNAPNGIFGFRYDKSNDTDLSIENLDNSSVNNNAGIRLASNHGNIKLRYFNNGGFYVQNSSASGYLHYFTNNVSRFYIDSSGNVNINNQGTIASSNGGVGKKLGIKSNANNVIIGETESSGNGSGLHIESRQSGRSGDPRIAQIGLKNDASGDGQISFFTAPNNAGVSERMTIKSDGKIGVNTLSPIGTLDVYDGTFVLSKPNASGGERNWRFVNNNVAAGNLGLQVSTAAGGSTFSNLIEITRTGRVGINEGSPDYMLHLSGSVPAICFEDTDGTHGQAIIEQNGDNLKIRQDAGNASSGGSSNIRFEVDGAERMRIENLGDSEFGAKFFDNKAIEFKSQDSGIFSNTWYINANTWTNFFSIPDYFQAWVFLNSTHNAGNSSALWSFSKSSSGGAHCNRFAHDNLYGPATVTFRINGVWVQIKSSYATYGYAIINATAGGSGVANLSG